MSKLKHILKSFKKMTIQNLILPILKDEPDISQWGEITGKIPKHVPSEITDNQLSEINRLTNTEHFRNILNEILIPRVVGTDGHKRVRNFIINSMEMLNWQIDRDIFDEKTPNLGTLKFENIIATQNPNAKKFLILACHYDSKYFPNMEFLGATDSAVPCAMLINLATILNNYLKQYQNNDISLMYVFFDGEEAFLQWNETDSIYGARNLAKKWNSNGFLKKIDLLILLDLIGAPDPKFYSFFKETEYSYTRLLNAEEKLTNLGYLEKHETSGIIRTNLQQYFQSRSMNSYIEDDHVPFLKYGVPILHLIPVPFPDFWHTKDDNLNVIDFTTVENLNKILRAFVAEYLKITFDKR